MFLKGHELSGYNAIRALAMFAFFFTTMGMWFGAGGGLVATFAIVFVGLVKAREHLDHAEFIGMCSMARKAHFHTLGGLFLSVYYARSVGMIPFWVTCLMFMAIGFACVAIIGHANRSFGSSPRKRTRSAKKNKGQTSLKTVVVVITVGALILTVGVPTPVQQGGIANPADTNAEVPVDGTEVPVDGTEVPVDSTAIVEEDTVKEEEGTVENEWVFSHIETDNSHLHMHGKDWIEIILDRKSQTFDRGSKKETHASKGPVHEPTPEPATAGSGTAGSQNATPSAPYLGEESWVSGAITAVMDGWDDLQTFGCVVAGISSGWVIKTYHHARKVRLLARQYPAFS